MARISPIRLALRSKRVNMAAGSPGDRSELSYLIADGSGFHVRCKPQRRKPMRNAPHGLFREPLVATRVASKVTHKPLMWADGSCVNLHFISKHVMCQKVSTRAKKSNR